MSEESLETTAVTDTADQTTSQETGKVYTQEEFDRHMAGLKASLSKKFEKQFGDLGDIEELRQLKTQAEAKRLEDAKKKGEYEKVIQEIAAKKDAEISKRDEIIRGYKIDMPLLDAAARFKAVNPEQVKQLIKGNIRLNDDGEVEVIGNDGTVRYDDSGRPVTVDVLVREFLDSNPHFAMSTPATTNSRSNVANNSTSGQFDLSQLDLSRADHRELYRQAKQKGLV